MSSCERVVLGGGLVMQPFVRYVLPAGPAQGYGLAMRRAGIEYTMSVFNPYYRPYGGTNLNGKRLAFYRHAAFGDQLMATSVAVYLKHLYPGAQIDVYCAPEVIDVWRGLPVRVYPAPIIFEAARAYDSHLLYDQMLEEDREPDQQNAYDSMFSFAGLGQAGDVFKRPTVATEDADYAELEALDAMAWMTEKYLVYQLGAGNPNRTYPYDQGCQFIESFMGRFPEWKIIVVGLGTEEAQRALFGNRRGASEGRVINLVNRLKSFRSLIPLVQRAGLVVCPDSSVGHLAAAFPKVPVISLWGLFSPEDRAKYYVNHFPLFPRDACPHAPCHNHEFKLPQALCSSAPNAVPGEQKWCNVLRSISPEAILCKAQKLIGGAG